MIRCHEMKSGIRVATCQWLLQLTSPQRCTWVWLQTVLSRLCLLTVQHKWRWEGGGTVPPARDRSFFYVSSKTCLTRLEIVDLVSLASNRRWWWCRTVCHFKKGTNLKWDEVALGSDETTNDQEAWLDAVKFKVQIKRDSSPLIKMCWLLLASSY